jgi:putative phage-type endonuclease
MQFQEKVKALTDLLENWLPEPRDATQVKQWGRDADLLAHTYEFTEKEQTYVDRIIEMYEEQFTEKIILQAAAPPDIPSKEQLDTLLNRKQIEQRTPEWYAQMTQIVSASELGNLFGSPRIRAKMVMSKTVPYEPRFQPLAVPSDSMAAFDWGIRFEPVVKQIYEHKYGAVVKELGRMIHPTYEKCSASPDGLVYSCPKDEKTGRLVEIKCPVTREIDGTVPKDYYAQMQMQLHVTGLKVCDYVEAVFASKYNAMAEKEGPGIYNGYIALVRHAEMRGDQEFYYVYSPVNADETWQPETGEGEHIMEMIPWRLLQWSEQKVARSEEWWESIRPVIDAFWEDVEKAKRGEFVVPESTRPAKRPKEEKCMIVLNKLDENGEQIKTNSETAHETPAQSAVS